MRIQNHPVLDFHWGQRDEIKFSYQGKEISAKKGDTIASALFNAGVKEFSKSKKRGRSRGFYCAIGKCSSCLMTVDGIPNVRTCITLAKEGMSVQEQEGLAKLPKKCGKSGDGSYEGTCETEVVVIGGGPAGLKAALGAAEAGASVNLIEENNELGGQLVKQTHKFFGSSEKEAGTRGVQIAKELENEVKNNEKIEVSLGSSVVGIYEGNLLGIYNRGKSYERMKADKIVLATGASERMISFPNNDLPGVYGAGGVQTLMNLQGIKPADKAIILGAGNVGLIVAYQLMQAGTDVKAIVEALPEIGGYFVHAAKVRGQGVPIFTSHTVVRVEGNDQLEKVITAEIDKNWDVVDGTKKEWEVDMLALAVGLSPGYKLADQAGCEIQYVSKLGGYVPIRDERLETTRDGIYIAGDLSGIEEATTAMMEGEIAGIAAAWSMGCGDSSDENKIRDIYERLDILREGPLYKGVREGLEEVVIS